MNLKVKNRKNFHVENQARTLINIIDQNSIITNDILENWIVVELV